MDIEGKMIRGEHALTPIEFIQELSTRVGETYYSVEEACAGFINSYDNESGKGVVDFLECSRYIDGMIPIALVDTSRDIAVSIDIYDDPYFIGADGDWHQMEKIEYSGDDESKYKRQEVEQQRKIAKRKQDIEVLQQDIAVLQRELDDLFDKQ